MRVARPTGSARPRLALHRADRLDDVDQRRVGPLEQVLARQQRAVERAVVHRLAADAASVRTTGPRRPRLVQGDVPRDRRSPRRWAAAWRRPGSAPPDLCPVADGGEGTLEALLTALGGETAGADGARPARAGR